MKAKINIILSIILVIALMIGGCGKEKKGNNSENQKKAKGRYVETFLNVPEGFKGAGSMCLREDGSICIVDKDNATVNVSKDEGNTWESKEERDLAKLVLDSKVEINAAVPAPDGAIFIAYVSWAKKVEGKTYPEKYIYIDKDGKKDEFELGIDNYQSSVIEAVFSAESELFVACNNNTIYKVDLKNHSAKKIMEVESINDYGLFQYGKSIGVCSGEKIYLHDPNTDKMDAPDGVLNNYLSQETKSKYTVVVGGNDDKKLIAASGSGIYSHIINGKTMEQLADGSLTTLGNPSDRAACLQVTKEGKILILFEDGKLASYTYDANALSVPDKKLTVYSLYDNNTVRMAINMFRKEQTDVYVEMKIGVSGEDGVTESDAIKNLNTEILSGEGPDIILLDGMPMDSYIEKGILMDMSKAIKDMEKEENYYQNILEAYRQDGKIYAVPIRFIMPLIAGEEKLVSSVGNLSALANVVKNTEHKKGTVVGTYTPEEILKRLYPVCEGAWVKEDGEADEKALEEFLNKAKEIYDADSKKLTSSQIQQHISVMDYLSKKNQKSVAGMLDPLDVSQQLFNMLEGGQQLSAGLYKSMSDVQTLVSLMNKEKNYGYQIYNGQKENVFIPSGVFGIVEKTKNKELAMQFLKCTLGKMVQGKDMEDGFPVNKSAFENFSENPNPKKNDSGVAISAGDDEGVVDLDYVWPKKKDLENLEKLFENMKTAANIDETLQGEIINIGSQVLSGNKESKDGAREISQKITLLKEE